jgi:hypothetical protein
MKRIFEIFYRKQIAQTTSPLNQRIVALEAELLAANNQLVNLRHINKDLADQIAKLTGANQENGLTRSRYVAINLPGELVDMNDVPLRGTYNGCECDYELECVAGSNNTLLLLRSNQSSANKIDLEVVGTGSVLINIKQRLVLNGNASIAFSTLDTVEIKPDVEDFFVVDYYCRPIQQLYEQATMLVNRIDPNS